MNSVTQMLAKRTVAWLTAVGFGIACFVVASSIQHDARQGEDSATSAPQQTVAETAATRDAGVNGIRLLGVLGGLVIFNLGLLVPGAIEDEEQKEADAIERGLRKRCAHCGELMRPQAKVCRFCGRDAEGSVQVVAGPPRTAGTPASAGSSSKKGAQAE
jgi:hypothetical protein